MRKAIIRTAVGTVLAAGSPALSQGGTDRAEAPGAAHLQIASGGWFEAVAIVRDLDRTVRFFDEIAGYAVIESGPASASDLAGLGLDPATEGRFAVLREPGETRGAIRVLELALDAPRVEIRSSANLFDTGGIAGLNVRVADIDTAFAKLQAAGWRAFSDPVRFDVDRFSVAEAIFRGPDGLVIGLIERQRPALGPEWRLGDGRLSRPNNAFAIVSDMSTELSFFEEKLGWKPFLVDRGKAADGPGPNLYGWPHNLVATVDRHVVWIHGWDKAGDGGSEGSIALMQFANLEGRDLSDRARAPNYGFVALRVAVRCAEERSGEVLSVANVRSPAGILVQTYAVGCSGEAE